ncbi:MEKHLA domain-containing protein [Epibacterium ulvae]|uniref:MEKHLA domain-containing protein n=1 Tax=Epibacterium ulvae TaxID=1156985 RepID=UPI002490085F|nr:MEKHLA domain-containing protein [Epibacterium ulvae]
MKEPSAANAFQAEQARLIVTSYQQVVGETFPVAEPEELYHAPFAVLSHNTDADPVLTYGNLFAQELFEVRWGDLVTMHSKNTAEQVHRNERNRMFETMRAQGYIRNYQGVRISASGKRFEIQNATIWPLLDTEGKKQGEAAFFAYFHRL